MVVNFRTNYGKTVLVGISGRGVVKGGWAGGAKLPPPPPHCQDIVGKIVLLLGKEKEEGEERKEKKEKGKQKKKETKETGS